MKAGLWILVAVIIAGVIVGSLLRRNLDDKISQAVEQKLAEAEKIEDVDARILALKRLVSQDLPDDARRRIYRRIARTMVVTKADTSGFARFAWDALEKERGLGSRSEVFYNLYRIQPDAGLTIARKILDENQVESWLYNYIAYDFFEKGINLDIGLDLANKAIDLAETRSDSAMYLDTRGAILLAKGMHLQAISDLEKAASMLEVPDVEILKHLGEAYLRVGDGEKAFKTFRAILVIGEYDFARSAIDSLMDLRRLSPSERDEFESQLWQERLSLAKNAEPFTVRTFEGEQYEYKPPTSAVTLVNLMSPT